MIDVVDDARLHIIAAVLDPTIRDQRIFAFNCPFNWTDIIKIVKELRPDAKNLPAPPEGELSDLSKVSLLCWSGWLTSKFGRLTACRCRTSQAQSF